jgi:cation-transporting ATPase 13A2
MDHRDFASAASADYSAAVPTRPRPPYLRRDGSQSSSGIFDDVEMAHDEASTKSKESVKQY